MSAEAEILKILTGAIHDGYVQGYHDGCWAGASAGVAAGAALNGLAYLWFWYKSRPARKNTKAALRIFNEFERQQKENKS